MKNLILITMMFTLSALMFVLFITIVVKYFYDDIIIRRIIPSNNRPDYIDRIIRLQTMRSIIRAEHYKKQIEINKQIKECIIIINPNENINLGYKIKNKN